MKIDNLDHQLSISIRAAKAKAIVKLSEVIKIHKHVKNENEEQRYGRLEESGCMSKIKMNSKDTRS